MGPWFLRQELTFGSISPTTSGGSALWIRTIQEWNSITADPSLSKFLAQGPGPIIGSRIGGLLSAIGNFAVIICSVVLVPFLLIGAWLRRRSIDFGPWFLYAFLVFLGATLLYPLHVPGGAFIHSAVGLEAHAYILSLEGVAAMVLWIAKRRPAWDPRTAIPLFVTAVVGVRRPDGRRSYAFALKGAWDESRAPRVALASQMDSLGVAPDDRLLTIDSAGLKYYTGRPGIVTPDDPIETIEQVAGAYDTRWLVLERDDIVARAGADPRRRGAPAVDRRAGLRRPGRRRRDPAAGACIRSASTTATTAAPAARRSHPSRPLEAPMSRREAVLSAALVFVVALLVRVVRGEPGRVSRSRRTPPTTSTSRGTSSSGRGLVSDALWSFQTPPLVVPRGRVRGLAAPADVPRGHPDGDLRVDVRGRPGQLGARRLARPGARLAARRGRRRGARRCRRGRARTLAIGTGLTAAVYLPLILHSDPARLDDAVRRPALAACLLMSRLVRARAAGPTPRHRGPRRAARDRSSGSRR